MKKTLLCLFIFSFSNFVSAQTYQTLSVSSGFNADVIANAIGAASASTTVGLDNANFCLMAANFQATAANVAPSYALPVSGLVNSPVTAGLSYQFADYSENNSARFTAQNQSVTMVFSNQVSATMLYLLTTSGSGISTVAGTVTFADNTTQTIGATTIPDWFYSTTLPVVIADIGRVGRLDNIIETSFGNPRLFQLVIPITVANQAKLVASISLTKTSSIEGAVNVFAVSAKLPALGLEQHQATKFVAYPNPTDNVLTILGSTAINEVQVYNLLGQKILALQGLGETELTLDTASLPTGNYMVKVATDMGMQALSVIKE